MVNAAPRPLYARERDPVPFVQEAGWAPGPVWTVAEIGIRSPDRQARSESLYRLSYPGPHCTYTDVIYFYHISCMKSGVRKVTQYSLRRDHNVPS